MRWFGDEKIKQMRNSISFIIFILRYTLYKYNMRVPLCCSNHAMRIFYFIEPFPHTFDFCFMKRTQMFCIGSIFLFLWINFHCTKSFNLVFIKQKQLIVHFFDNLPFWHCIYRKNETVYISHMHKYICIYDSKIGTKKYYLWFMIGFVLIPYSIFLVWLLCARWRHPILASLLQNRYYLICPDTF